MKEGVPGFMAALYLYVKTGTSVQVYDLLAFWGGRRDQNIPHRPAYPAGSAGYITLANNGTVMKALKTISAIIFMSVSTLAHAEFYSGSKLFGFLEKDIRGQADYESGIGTGYVIGVFDSLSGILVCAPGGVTVRQVKQVVYNYMQKHPELWEKSADRSVIGAFAELWPCAKK